MKLGRQMQFFGARVNLAKALLYAINGGRDEMTGDQIAPPRVNLAKALLYAINGGRTRCRVIRLRRDAAGDQRHPRIRRGFREVRSYDGVAGAHLRARHELHPLHARQVLL